MKKTTKQTNKQTNTMREETKIVVATKKDYYSNRDCMQLENKKVKGLLELRGKKQIFIYEFLLQNSSLDYNFSLDSLTNEYRKVVKRIAEGSAKKEGYTFRKSFKSKEVINLQDLKATIFYIYHINKRLFEYYRNAKGNYILHEVEYKENLSLLRENVKK